MIYLLAIDLGTSAVKTLVVNTSGQILSSGSGEYPIYYPLSGHVEQNPTDWMAAVVKATREALAGAGSKSGLIAAIGLTGQMHGTVLSDAKDNLVSPAVIWPDQRSQQQVEEIIHLLGRERLAEITGGPVATGFQAATLRWFQQEYPVAWQQARRIFLPKDYLRWRLTGEFHTDPSDASGTALFDVRTRNWSAEILAELAIDKEQLPPLLSSIATAGQLLPVAATALGLKPGIPVVTGAADTAASLLGAGIDAADTLLMTISTGGQMTLPAAQIQPDSQGRFHTLCGALEPEPKQAGWYQMAAILSAGLAMRWLRQLLGFSGIDAYARMTALAEGTPPGARGLIFLPYLVGERAPHNDPQARGLFLGLTARHGQAALIRAVMEGVTLACYDAFWMLAEAGAAPRRIVMAGGGAKSRLWQQITADIFDLPVQRLTVTEQSALGATLLAGAGIGLFDPAATARTWAAYDPPVEPISQNHRRYQELLPIFRSAYRKHRDDFCLLQQFGD